MPDLTFSEIELERNVLGKSASSETWLDGVVVSSAEATRKRIPNVQSSQAEAVAAAAKARGGSQYDAGHWYWQPVGGRAVRTRLLAPRTVREGPATRGQANGGRAPGSVEGGVAKGPHAACAARVPTAWVGLSGHGARRVRPVLPTAGRPSEASVGARRRAAASR